MEITHVFKFLVGMNLGDEMDGTESFPEATYRNLVSKEWREGLWWEVYAKTGHTMRRGSYIDHLHQPHIDPEGDISSWCISLLPHAMVPCHCHFHSYVFAAVHLRCRCSCAIIVTYRLVLQARGYIECSFGPLRRINVLWMRDKGWIWRDAHCRRGDPLLWQLSFCSAEAMHARPLPLMCDIFNDCHYHHFSLIVANTTACSSSTQPSRVSFHSAAVGL